MDAGGNIYELSDEQQESLLKEPDITQIQEIIELREDVGRLDGYLKRRAEEDHDRREKFLARYGTQVWDSSKGPYRKERIMGIKGIEDIAGHQSDPGDEQDEETSEPTLPSPDEVIETLTPAEPENG